MRRVLTERFKIPLIKVLTECNYHTWGHYYDNGDFEGVVAKLEIKAKSPNIFTLEWEIQNDKKDKLWGEGMLCDGMLIGDYRDFQNP